MSFIKDFYYDVMVGRSDKFAILCATILVMTLTFASDPTLREVSTTLSLICLMGLIWRFIGSLPRLTPLSITLSVALMLTLATGALAQYLLSREVNEIMSIHAPPVSPDNTLGISFILAGRLFILYIIVRWTALLDAWERRVAGGFL